MTTVYERQVTAHMDSTVQIEYVFKNETTGDIEFVLILGKVGENTKASETLFKAMRLWSKHEDAAAMLADFNDRKKQQAATLVQK